MHVTVDGGARAAGSGSGVGREQDGVDHVDHAVRRHDVSGDDVGVTDLHAIGARIDGELGTLGGFGCVVLDDVGGR